jgi:flagellar assembly protein FliH
MAVIKAEHAPVQSMTPFSMADIERHAKSIVVAARGRAERLILAAQQEAEDLKRAAHAQALVDGKKEGIVRGIEEGRAMGREQSLNEQRQQLSSTLAALTDAVQQLDASRIHLESEAKTAVVRLAIAIADRVTKRMGRLDTAVAEANIDEALRLVVQSADVRIAVHPSQKATLTELLPRLQAKWPNLKHVDLIADGTLTPGGCRLFSAGGGQVDADLDLQLERIAKELLPSTDETA